MIMIEVTAFVADTMSNINNQAAKVVDGNDDIDDDGNDICERMCRGLGVGVGGEGGRLDNNRGGKLTSLCIVFFI